MSFEILQIAISAGISVLSSSFLSSIIKYIMAGKSEKREAYEMQTVIEKLKKNNVDKIFYSITLDEIKKELELETHLKFEVLSSFSYYQSLVKMQKNSEINSIKSKPNYTNTIVGLITSNKSKVNLYSYLCLFLSLIIYISSSLIFSEGINFVGTLIICSLIVCNYLNQKILEYRVKKGFYGTNEAEAKEILKFILKNSSNTDINNGEGFTVFSNKEDYGEIFSGVLLPELEVKANG